MQRYNNTLAPVHVFPITILVKDSNNITKPFM